MITSPCAGIKDGIVNATINANNTLYGFLGNFVFIKDKIKTRPIIRHSRKV